MPIPFDKFILYNEAGENLTTSVRPPFISSKILESNIFYTLVICKDCRSKWLAAIENWFGNKPIRSARIIRGRLHCFNCLYELDSDLCYHCGRHNDIEEAVEIDPEELKARGIYGTCN